VASGRALAAGVIAANVAALVEGGLETMFLNKLKVVVTVLVAGILATGAGVWAFQNEPRPGPRRAPHRVAKSPPAPGPQESAKGKVADERGSPEVAIMKQYQDNPRLVITALARSVAARDKSPGTPAILAKLEEPISMSFANETPLEDVLKYIKSASSG